MLEGFNTKNIGGLETASTEKSIEQILGFLSRASSEIGVSLDWQETLDHLSKVVVPAFAEQCSIWWLDSAGVPAETKKYQITPDPEISFEADSAKLIQVIKTGNFENENKEHYFSIYTPMRLRNIVMGVLIVRRTHKFNAQDVLIAQELASRGVIALDNAKVYQELKETRQIAEDANQAKSLFLANMSHEIRTPLTAILGFIDLMLTLDVQENITRFRDWSERIKANGAHLQGIIEKVLDLSKSESGKFEIKPELVASNKILTQVYHALLPQAAIRRNELKFYLDTPIPEFIETDPTRLQQILVNIVGNAIKFTEKGLISVHCSYKDTNAQIQITISDTGIGLTEPQIKKIFKPFTQGDASHTRIFGGTGLGLHLSRELARLMGGDLVLLHSNPNEGATFQIQLNIGPMSSKKCIEYLNFALDENEDFAKGQSLEDSRRAKPAGRVLLAEDAPDNQMIIKFILQRIGMEVAVAADGGQALRMATESHYDLILMDIQMPVLSGHEVCQQLRKAGYRGPIVALTAHVLKEEHDKAINSGCNDILTKPIDRKKLISVVQAYVNAGKEQASEAGPDDHLCGR